MPLGVLTHATGEDNGIDAAHLGHVRTDHLLGGVGEHVVCESRTLEAGFGRRVDVAHIGRDATDAVETRLAIENRDNLVGGVALRSIR